MVALNTKRIEESATLALNTTGCGEIVISPHPVPSFFKMELQEQIRLNIKNRRDVEQQVQGHAPVHARRLHRGQVLPADPQAFRHLLLRIALFLPVIPDCVGQVFLTLHIVEVYQGRPPAFYSYFIEIWQSWK